MACLSNEALACFRRSTREEIIVGVIVFTVVLAANKLTTIIVLPILVILRRPMHAIYLPITSSRSTL